MEGLYSTPQNEQDSFLNKIINYTTVNKYYILASIIAILVIIVITYYNDTIPFMNNTESLIDKEWNTVELEKSVAALNNKT